MHDFDPHINWHAGAHTNSTPSSSLVAYYSSKKSRHRRPRGSGNGGTPLMAARKTGTLRATAFKPRFTCIA